MQLVRVTLTRDPAADRPHHAVLVDCLWAAAEHRDLVEHISVRNSTAAEHTEVGIFLRSADDTAGRTTALDLVERALRNSPRLRHWTVAGAIDIAIAEIGE